MKKVALLLVVALLLLAVGMAAADSSPTMVIPPDGEGGAPRKVVKLLPPPDDTPQVQPIALPLRSVPQPDPDCPAKINEGGIWVSPVCGNPQGTTGLRTSGLR